MHNEPETVFVFVHMPVLNPELKTPLLILKK